MGGGSLFSKDAVVTGSTLHVRLVEPVDGDSWTWRTNCPPQTGNRSCKIRRKNIWKPRDSKLQVKMGKLEKELEVLATASVQSQDVCVCDLTQSLLASQSAAETATWLHLTHS